MNEGPHPLAVTLVLCFIILALWFFFTLIADERDILYEEGSIEVVFCPVENCETKVVDTIKNATDVVCAFYDFSLPSIIDALSEAQVLVYDKNADAGIPVPSKGLMHHKFCVLDSQRIITGSMNPTENGVSKNDNNLLIIESPTLAAAYLREFEELASRKKTYEKRAKGTTVNINGSVITLLFCPQEQCENTLLNEIQRAQHNIIFMTFTFTADKVGDALLDAHDRGVYVEGVIEKRQMSKWSEHEKLRQWGIDVAADGNSWTMHHKVFIIDNTTVITGSYNPTKSANTKNDENMLIVRDMSIAEAFLQEYSRVRAE